MKNKLLAMLLMGVLAMGLVACGDEATEESAAQEATVEDTKDAEEAAADIIGGTVDGQVEWLTQELSVVYGFEQEYYTIVKEVGATGDAQAVYDALAELSVRTTAEAETIKGQTYYDENATLAEQVSYASIDLNEAVLQHMEALMQDDVSILDKVEELMGTYKSEVSAALDILEQ